MLLADEQNIREVILFPMNQRAEDLMMSAPSEPIRPTSSCMRAGFAHGHSASIKLGSGGGFRAGLFR